ncbi:MAG: thiamine pyrophosphate-binding protein [bacterium]
MARFHGGAMIVRALNDEGVEHVFTIGGGHIAHVSDSLMDSDINIYDTRHEQAAVMMADAWARCSGRPGVALVTAGPGFTNSLTGVANAQLAGVPLVIIAGVVPTNMVGRLDLQEMEQHDVIKPLVKWSRRVENPERLPAVIHEAMNRACSGKPGPVYVEVPTDVMGAEIDEKYIDWGKRIEPSRSSPDPAGIKEAAELIKGSRRPVIIAGSGVAASRAEKELKELVETTGIPCFTSSMGKGCLPDTHPLCYGPSLAIRPGAALAGMSQADCLVLLGTRISLFYAHGRLFNKDAKIINVNLDPEEFDRNRPADVGIAADAAAAARELTQALSSKVSKEQFENWRRTLEEAARQSLAEYEKQSGSEAVPIHPARLAREVDEFLSPADVLVLDGGDTSVWMNMARTNYRRAGTIESGLFGCLGVGLPYALAAKLALPDQRVYAIMGDGSVGFNFMEFHTSIRFGLPIVVIINNDQAWGMVRHSQQLRFGMDRTPATDLGYVPYHKLVEALGGYGEEVTEPADIKNALERATASGKTACVNVLTDREVISPGSVALSAIGKPDLPLDEFGA